MMNMSAEHWKLFVGQVAKAVNGAGLRRLSALNTLKERIIEEEKRLREEKPCVYIGVPAYGKGCDGFWQAFLTSATDGQELTVMGRKYTNSLLGRSFNHVWADAVYQARAGRVTHFAMLHTDVVPSRHWVDTLWEECTRLNADIVSCAIPIKDGKGITSTAVDDPENPWQVKRRLTMREVMELPETFDANDLHRAGLNPDNNLMLVNTGCWICDMRKPWTTAVNKDNTLKCYFTIQDRVERYEDGTHCVSVIPEDWGFTRMVKRESPDAKIYCTRKVQIDHRGETSYPNHVAWGEYEHDEEILGPPQAESVPQEQPSEEAPMEL